MRPYKQYLLDCRKKHSFTLQNHLLRPYGEASLLPHKPDTSKHLLSPSQSHSPSSSLQFRTQDHALSSNQFILPDHYPRMNYDPFKPPIRKLLINANSDSESEKRFRDKVSTKNPDHELRVFTSTVGIIPKYKINYLKPRSNHQTKLTI